MRKGFLIGLSTMVMVFAGQAFAGKTPSKIIFLEGKDYGSVHFSHILHQKKLTDCEICHQFFPREMGAIERGVDNGTLKPRQIMDHCTKCHKETAMAGKPSGPTSCKGCHWD